MKASRALVREQAKFANDRERDDVLRVYDQGIRQMQARIDAQPKLAP